MVKKTWLKLTLIGHIFLWQNISSTLRRSSGPLFQKKCVHIKIFYVCVTFGIRFSILRIIVTYIAFILLVFTSYYCLWVLCDKISYCKIFVRIKNENLPWWYCFFSREVGITFAIKVLNASHKDCWVTCQGVCETSLFPENYYISFRESARHIGSFNDFFWVYEYFLSVIIKTLKVISSYAKRDCKLRWF